MSRFASASLISAFHPPFSPLGTDHPYMADKDLSDRPAHGVETGRPAFADWSRVFLGELAATSNVSAAARLAGVSTFIVYETRRSNPEFNHAWREALCEGYDHLEMALLFRLRAGEIKPATGAKRGVRQFDNATSLRLLTAHREAVAQQRAVRDNEDAETILASLNAKLERMRERSLAANAEHASQGTDPHAA